MTFVGLVFRIMLATRPVAKQGVLPIAAVRWLIEYLQLYIDHALKIIPEDVEAPAFVAVVHCLYVLPP